MSLFGKENYSYNSSVRGYVVLFGTLFSDMVLKRQDKWISVPLRHGRGNLYEKAPQNAAARDGTRVREVLPSASFFLDSLQRDPTRQTARYQPIDVSAGQLVESRVPYNLNFNLIVRVKNMEDHLQLLEQIGINFDPTYTSKFKPWAESGVIENVVITLQDQNVDDNSDSQADDEERIIETTYTFILRGYLTKALKSVDVIEEVVLSTGTDDFDLTKTVFVSDRGVLKIMREQDALKKLIEEGLVETTVTNPAVVKETTKKNRRRKTLNN